MNWACILSVMVTLSVVFRSVAIATRGTGPAIRRLTIAVDSLDMRILLRQSVEVSLVFWPCTDLRKKWRRVRGGSKPIARKWYTRDAKAWSMRAILDRRLR